MKKSHERILVIVLLGVVVLGLGSGVVGLQSFPGMTTSYEGVKARYHGLYVPTGTHGASSSLWGDFFLVPSTGYFVTNRGAGSRPTSPSIYDPPLHSFSTDMSFDLYDQRLWSCNLQGEMTSVTLPEAVIPDYVEEKTWWLNRASQVTETYQWEVPLEGDDYEVFTMTEYVVKWFFSISADFDTGPVLLMGEDVESYHRRYTGVEVWFELDVNDGMWYFEDQPNEVYFAIAKIEMMDDARTSVKVLDQDRNEVIGKGSTQYVRVTPMSIGSLLPLYFSPFGSHVGEEYVENEETTYRSYQGKQLNPALFRDTIYTRYTLTNFGTHSWPEGLSAFGQGDVVTVGLNVHIFVFGEWVVRDVSDRTDLDDYGGRTPQYVEEIDPIRKPLFDVLNWLAGKIEDPFTMLGVGLWTLALAAVVIFVLFGGGFGFLGRRRRGIGGENT